MKNQKTTRNKSYDQTDDKLKNYRTDDPAAIYQTKQNDEQLGAEIKRREDFVRHMLRKR